MTDSAIVPDTKDWTWVLTTECRECHLDTRSVDRADLGRLLRDNATGWTTALRAPRVTARPRPGVWSVTEYACHVRDIHVLFAERLGLMLRDDDPVFANWNQDVTAVESRYDLAAPGVVGPELVAAAERVAALYDSVPDDAWSRPGRRSNGDHFTVETLGRYHLHDVVHHLWDVAGAVTVAGYDAAAAEYGASVAAIPDPVRAAIDHVAAVLPPGSRILEIGSATGRDAADFESAGMSVRRTDITPAFVDLLRADGHAADVIDPLTDDLDDPMRPGSSYDGVWANASLLHVARADLPDVLRRLRAATRPGGMFWASVKEGVGEGWSTHGAVSTPRRFVFWQEPELRVAMDAAGWQVEAVDRSDGAQGTVWLEVRATRR